MSAHPTAGVIAAPEDIASAKALIAALESESMPSDRHDDCTALCIADLEQTHGQ